MKKSGKEHSIAVKILPLAVILLLAVGALLYGANRWVIQIDILGDQTQYVEYGAKFEDPGAAAVRKELLQCGSRKDGHLQRGLVRRGRQQQGDRFQNRHYTGYGAAGDQTEIGS